MQNSCASSFRLFPTGVNAEKLLGSAGNGMRSTAEILAPLRDSTAAASRGALKAADVKYARNLH